MIFIEGANFDFEGALACPRFVPMVVTSIYTCY